ILIAGLLHGGREPSVFVDVSSLDGLMKKLAEDLESVISIQSDNSSLRMGKSSKQPSDISAIIKKSSRFLKQKNQHFVRENPCGDDQAFAILSLALHTRVVRFSKLFRYATCLDFVLIALGIICSLLAALFYVATIYSFGLFNHFFHNQTAQPCLNIKNFDGSDLSISYPYVWLSIILTIFAFLQSMLFDLSAVRQVKRIRLEYVESIVKKDSTWFDCYIDRDLPFRIAKDMQEMRLGMGESLGKLVFHTTVSILMMAASFVLSFKVAIIAAFIVPAFTITSLLKVKASRDVHKDEIRLYRPANTVATQLLSKVLLIKSFCGEAKAVKDYASALYSACDLRSNILLTALWASLAWFISLVSHPFLIWLSIEYFDDYDIMMSNIKSCNHCGDSLIWVCPHIPLYGRLDTILMYLTFAVYFLSNMPNVYSRIKKAQFVAAEVFFYIDWKAGINNISKDGHIPRPNAIGKVALKDVSFNYPLRPATEVIHNINIVVHPGQMIAIFGPSKCGKTTMLRLMLRKYDICEGSIQLDGAELHTLNVPWLRSQIGYVSQYPRFLNGTIEEIISGFLKPSMEEIMRVCKKADVISDILALPEGFKTRLGNKSQAKLSLWQMKKIYLAHIFLRKSRLILLDDFFANTDERSENSMVELFESMRESFTLIITSRKIKAIMKVCDTIYVMKEGQIVQFGNHDIMSTKKGIYMDFLQETLQEERKTIAMHPKTDSQLIYYKFGDAIRRVHDLHDKDHQRDYSKLRENKKAINSVLLRHNIRTHEQILPSHLTGGYNKFITFYTPLDKHYELNLLRHQLVNARDLRAKVLPDLDLDGYPGVQTKLRNKPATITLERFVQDHEQAKDLHVDSNFSTDSAIESSSSKSKMETENVIDMLFANFKKKNYPTSEKIKMDGSMKSRILGWKTAGLARLQHYYGWSINSPVDTDSIRSEDSYLFWQDYSSRLQLSNKSTRDPIRLIDFIKIARHAWPYFLLTFLTSTTLGLCLVYTVFETSEVMAAYLVHERKNTFLDQVEQVVYWACLAFVVSFAQETILPLGLCTINKFRVAHFAALLEQEMRWFANRRNDIEYLCEFLATDLWSINIVIIEWIAICSESLVILISSAVVILVHTGTLWPKNLALLGIIPVLIFINYLQAKNRMHLTEKSDEESEKLMYEMISNISTVITQGLSGHILNLYKQLQFEPKNPTLSRRFRYVWSFVKRHLIYALSRASFLLSLSAWTVVFWEDYFTHQEAVLFVIVTYLMFNGVFPMGFAFGILPSYKDHADSASFIFETMNSMKINKMINENQRSFNMEHGTPPPAFTFENVSCADSVHSDVVVLRGLNFVIPSGNYVAIVSSSAASRIAFMGLLYRFYDPEEGKILINGINYNELQVRSLRRNIVKVSQDPDFFMDLSIADNIAYGDNSRNVSKEDIIKAGKLAHIDDIIEEMPQEYNTKLKDLPVNAETFALKQRIGVARAAVRKAKVVIVNELTVSVDEECDRLLMKSLMNLRKGRTFIVISQRIHPIRGADTIVVINESTVAEMGADKDLLKKKGLYYEMYMSQQLYERGTEVALADIKMSSFISE
ncbi:unnamed protein product, partial [Allacma fusca]